ncbi:hypothetical protein JHK87_028490 [Glycine soja]|nr:hypothetical protein JHK87_028490 [Glycine soja]
MLDYYQHPQVSNHSSRMPSLHSPPNYFEGYAHSICKFELLDLRNSRGIAKVLGTLISLAGALIIALYKGNLMRNLWRPLIHIPGKSAAINESWLKGSLLTVLSCVTWSIWCIMQAATLKRYPAQLSLVTWMSFVGAAQSAVFTVIVEHNRSAWTIGLNIDLWSTIYGAATLKRYPAPLSLTTWMCFLGAAQSAVLTVIVERNPSAWTIGFNIDLWSTIYGVKYN